MFGNMISHSVRHSRRFWKPNVQRKRLWSDALGIRIRLHVTTSVLKTIDLYGGLDNYLLQTADSKIDSVFGSQLKAAVRAARNAATKPRKVVPAREPAAPAPSTVAAHT